MHPSGTGHRVAAEILHRVIRDEKLLDAAAPAPRLHVAHDASMAAAAVEAARSLGTQKADYGFVRFNKAVELKNAGRLDEAIEELRGVADTDSPKAVDAGLAMAMIWTEQGKLDQAKARLESILASNPAHPEAHFALAGVYRGQQKVDESIEHLKRTVELRPEAFEAHFNLGILSGGQGNWDQALASMEKAVELRPNDIQANQALADVLSRLGRQREAAQYARRANELERPTAAK
jgi:tetratricopeptide (TPR) repeat protein